jgi:hypothetical protein
MLGKVIVISLAVLLIAVQLVPVDRSNPTRGEDLQAPPAISKVLRQSCYDCHSNETKWPWYAHVAPVSWMLAYHVHEGRGKLNFSNWNHLSDKERAKLGHEIWEETSGGEMPLRVYLFLHAEARLNDDAIAMLRTWSESLQKSDRSD